MPHEPTTLRDRLREERRTVKRQRQFEAKTRRMTGSDDLVNIIGVDMLTLAIGGKTYEFNVRDELSITNSDADKTLDSHSERLAMWGNLAETVKHEIALMEIDLDDLRKSRYLAYRAVQRESAAKKNREGHKPEKWTDRETTAVIDTDADVVKMRKEIATKKQCLGYCTSMVRAFTQRGKMIVKWGKMTEHADDNVDS